MPPSARRCARCKASPLLNFRHQRRKEKSKRLTSAWSSLYERIPHDQEIPHTYNLPHLPYDHQHNRVHDLTHYCTRNLANVTGEIYFIPAVVNDGVNPPLSIYRRGGKRGVSHDLLLPDLRFNRDHERRTHGIKNRGRLTYAYSHGNLDRRCVLPGKRRRAQGKIDIGDVVVILRKAAGIHDFYEERHRL